MFVLAVLIHVCSLLSLALSEAAPFDPLQYVEPLIGSAKDGQYSITCFRSLLT
jgi:hypothetical protein